MATTDLVLRGGRVLDPAAGIDMVGDIEIDNGRIASIGGDAAHLPDRREIDVRGAIVSPGLVDIHMHAFGGIGFADADTVGVHSGVVAMCDAGGAGASSFDDFHAQLIGRLRTDLYSWLYIGSSGIAVSLVNEEQQKDIRSIVPELPITRLLELVDHHRDVISGMKVPAFGPTGEIGPMTMAKGLARTLGLPLYIHVGDIQENQPLPLDMDAIIDLLGPDDTVTHCYSPNPNSLFREDGTLYPSIRAAVDRGVGFDVGMGAFNFDFRIAQRALDVGFTPTTISSDLQQANVTGPTHSLVNVMSIFLRLGLPVEQIIPMVTTNAAARLGATDRHGTLAVGRSADITVLDVVDREVVFRDTCGQKMPGDRTIDVRFTVKNGTVFEPNVAAAADTSNWSGWTALQEDGLPEAVGAYDTNQRLLLGELADALTGLPAWDPATVQIATTKIMSGSRMPRGSAGRTVLGAFLQPVFPQSPGYFIATLDRAFAIDRLRAAAR